MMLAVGLATAVVLALSFASDYPSASVDKNKTEQEDADSNILIAQPSDVVLTAHSTLVDDTPSWVIALIFGEPDEEEKPPVISRAINSCFRFLLRAVIISPNAP